MSEPWICPKCGRVNAWWVATCQCFANTTYIVLPDEPIKAEVISSMKKLAATLKPKDRKVVEAAIARIEKELP